MNISGGAWSALRGAAALDKCPDAPGRICAQDADAIILDAQDNGVTLACQAHVDSVRMGVPLDVGQCLMAGTQQRRASLVAHRLDIWGDLAGEAPARTGSGFPGRRR